MRALLPGLLVLTLAVAGCVVEAPVIERGPNDPLALSPVPGAPGAAGNLTDPANLTADAAPAWELGQWWRLRHSDGDVETRVVTADLGSFWRVQTDNVGVAYFDALVDITTIGRIRKADLAGDQRGSAVEFFRFPLVENATWTTTWDGVPRKVTVLGPQPANVGGRTYNAIALEAREGDAVVVRYNYVPAIGWYSYLDFPARGPSGQGFRLDVADAGVGYNGTVAEVGVRVLRSDRESGPFKPDLSFTVPSGIAFVDFIVRLEGDAVGWTFTFRHPDGITETRNVPASPCTANCTVQTNWSLPAKPGEWKVVASGATHGTSKAPLSQLTVNGVDVVFRRIGTAPGP